MKTAATSVLTGILAGFAIVGAEALFLRVLPTTSHALLAIAVGIAAASITVSLRARLSLARDGQ